MLADSAGQVIDQNIKKGWHLGRERERMVIDALST